MKIKALITGAGGMLAGSLIKVLSNEAVLYARNRKSLDICDKEAVQKEIVELKPDIVLNCAAYTDVDGCETDEKRAFAVNAEGVKNVAEACKKTGSKMLHISTDFVFNGLKTTPYAEEDIPEPLSVYGSSKLQGEKYITEALRSYLIIRTSWLFGSGGKNFVSTIAGLSEKGSDIKVVADQKGSPTYTHDLAEAIKILIFKKKSGSYNICNSGICSWHEFAWQIIKLMGKQNSVIPIMSDELQRPAERPAFSALDCRKIEYETGHVMRPWQEALCDYIKILKEQKR